MHEGVEASVLRFHSGQVIGEPGSRLISIGRDCSDELEDAGRRQVLFGD